MAAGAGSGRAGRAGISGAADAGPASPRHHLDVHRLNAVPVISSFAPASCTAGTGVVLSGTGFTGATSATLDLTGLPAGVYAVRCGAATARLVVE